MIDRFRNEADRSYRGAFTDDEYADVRAYYRETPATPLQRVDKVDVKDESQRGGLGAFKVMGVSYAVDRLIRDGQLTAGATLVCASAGNHGRAVAHVGRIRGFPVRVYMSAGTPAPAQDRIRGEGAEVVIVDGTYDDAVARARSDGGFIVSDTAWPGYERVPRLIMAGYTQILNEAEAQWDMRPDVVFVQAGVGSLASSVVSWFCHRYGDARPELICVEAWREGALAGRTAGRRSELHGTTIMAGLDCDEPSSTAVPILQRGCDEFIAVDDDLARDAMRKLAAAGISAGPSGAAGYAGFLATQSASRAFVINTEGS